MSGAAKKILHMHFGKDGGAERFFVNLVRAFGEAGHAQRFATRPGRIWHEEIADLGPIMTDHYRRLSLTAPVFAWRVHRLIETWKPDVIMAWMSRSSRLIPAYPGAVKLTRLGDYPRHLRHFRHNDLIVANTPGIAERCRELGWTRPVHVVSNFARQVDVRPVARAAHGTPEEAFVICGSGRFVTRKGFDTLIRAAAAVPGAWLWLVGTGEQEPALRALAEAEGMAARVRFFGWVEEPMHYVGAADVFVMPSRHEPLGNVILEAWHAGVPVVSTRSEGPSWFASDGADALLVGIDDVPGMAGAIGRLRDDPALAARLVAGGRETLNARFTKPQVLAQYQAIFDGDY
jgi:glycosyltransferase involved in cell wall biosynthesis